jgi:hypothetical protein
MVFLVRCNASGSVRVFYPSPAGATEAFLDADSWMDITRSNPVLHTMQPDVEALLVYREKRTRNYYLAPIDECYRLTGLIRRHWRGFSGGNEVWEMIEQFFARLKLRSVPAHETRS